VHLVHPLRARRQRKKGWLIVLACAALWGASQGARAESAATKGVIPAECDAPLAGISPTEDLAGLRAIEFRCHKHAPFLHRLGQLLNQLGRYDEAIDPLEGALLYRPEHWPSQLEFAIALEGSGDHISAQGLLASLAQDPKLDPDTREQIQQLMGRPVTPTTVSRNISLSLATGYDNNLLGATSSTEFNLTTANGLIPVQLSEDLRPRAGTFVRAEAVYDGQLSSSYTSVWRYTLAASLRGTQGFPAADQSQWSFALERATATDHGPYLLFQSQTLVQASATAVQQTQVGAGYDILASRSDTCQVRFGIDAQSLRYPGNLELNGIYTGIASHTSCPGLGLHFQFRGGVDQPQQDSRPGGTQRQYNMRISKRNAVGAGFLTLDWHVGYQQDNEGYSALLSDNARRALNRQSIRAEYRWQSGNWAPYIGMEWLEQRSNIALFALQNQVLTVGFRSVW